MNTTVSRNRWVNTIFKFIYMKNISRALHVKKFHLPDFQNFALVNYIWLRKKTLLKSTCPTVRFTCPGSLASGISWALISYWPVISVNTWLQVIQDNKKGCLHCNFVMGYFSHGQEKKKVFICWVVIFSHASRTDFSGKGKPARRVVWFQWILMA